MHFDDYGVAFSGEHSFTFHLCRIILALFREAIAKKCMRASVAGRWAIDKRTWEA